MAAALHRLLAAVATGLVDAQLGLDERGRDSIDDFEFSGVPPTVLTWSSLRVEVPVGVTLRPRAAAGGSSDARVGPSGDGRLTCRLRYLLAPQGGDDPRPVLPDGDDREDRS
jgi:hypothetical protein